MGRTSNVHSSIVLVMVFMPRCTKQRACSHPRGGRQPFGRGREVSCFFHNNDGIFPEYMRNICLSRRIQHNHVRDHKSMPVIRVEIFKPMFLQKTWMNDLSHAVAFPESLNLAHGDLRNENVLLDRNRPNFRTSTTQRRLNRSSKRVLPHTDGCLAARVVKIKELWVCLVLKQSIGAWIIILFDKLQIRGLW